MTVSRRARDGWLALLVAASALAAFSPSLLGGFVVWDDDIYLSSNQAFRGFDLAHLKWAWTTTLYGHYMPLVWSSWCLDYRLWGLGPWGYHLGNVLLHALSSLLAFFVFREVLRAAGVEDERASLGAAAGALLFAVHPLRVESVAWIAERKDCLTGVFWLGALLAYLRRRVWLALALFAGALLAKPSGLALPLVLLVVDVYPLGRLPAQPRRWLEARWRPVWREKAAFALVAAAGAALSAASLTAFGELRGLGEVGAAWRLSMALYGLWFYPLKTLWPAGLAAFHPPLPWFAELLPRVGLIAATSAASVLAWSARRRFPAVPAALACYALLAAPALGGVQNGMPFRACDRYAYLPCLPFAMLFGAAVAAAARRRRALSLGCAGVLVAGYGAAAYAGVPAWRDTASLWERALEADPSSVALNNLGVARAEQGRLDEAVSLFERAASGSSAYGDAWENLGLALARRGRADALDALRHAHAVRPTARGRVMIGLLFAEGTKARRRAAEKLLSAAVADGEPGARGALALVRFNEGNALLARGRDADAERRYREALALDPALARAEVNLGNILARRGRFAEAAARYRGALKRDAGLVEARVNLSVVERLRRR